MSWDNKNDNFLQLLKKLAEGDGKDFVAILGAGVSKNSGLPLWAELRSELCDLLEQHWKDIGKDADTDLIERIRKKDLWDAFSDLRRELGENISRTHMSVFLQHPVTTRRPTVICGI